MKRAKLVESESPVSSEDCDTSGEEIEPWKTLSNHGSDNVSTVDGLTAHHLPYKAVSHSLQKNVLYSSIVIMSNSPPLHACH